MITRWMFYFDKENIRSDVSSEEENDRITTFIRECPESVLELPGDKACVYVNLAFVKCIVSHVMSQEELDAEQSPKEINE